MKEYRYIKLTQQPSLIDVAAEWFHSKWAHVFMKNTAGNSYVWYKVMISRI